MRKILRAITRAKEVGIDGNTEGDGFQMGGTVVVRKGGGIVYEFRQQDFDGWGRGGWG